MNEINASFMASPKKRGQPARTMSIVGKNDCKTGSQIDMDLNLRYVTVSLDGLRVFLCTMGLFYALDTSLHVKHPAHAWHTAGGHLMLGTLVSFCGDSSVLWMQRQESATAPSGNAAH